MYRHRSPPVGASPSVTGSITPSSSSAEYDGAKNDTDTPSLGVASWVAGGPGGFAPLKAWTWNVQSWSLVRFVTVYPDSPTQRTA